MPARAASDAPPTAWFGPGNRLAARENRGVDQNDAAIFMAMPLRTDDEVVAWFDLLHTAHAGLSDPDSPDEFAGAVRAAATWCDPEPFLDALAGAGEGLAPIARLAADPPRLPDDYWVLYHQWYPEATDDAAEEEPFSWVTAEQASRLQQAWGNDWRDHLGPQLDYRWGAGWEDHPVDHRQHWLNDVLDELLAPAAPTADPQPAADGRADGAEDLDAVARQMVEETLAELEDEIEPMSAEEIADAVAIVRRELEEEMTRD